MPTSTITASAGRRARGLEVEKQRADAKPNAETTRPFTITGSARPRKSAIRFAGVASSGESV